MINVRPRLGNRSRTVEDEATHTRILAIVLQAGQSMTLTLHRSLAAGRWQELTLVEQLANIGSEVGRALRATSAGNESRAAAALDRALELFDLTLADERWHRRRREIARAREVVTRRFFTDDGGDDESLDRYFLEFAAASRRAPARPADTRRRVRGAPEIDVARVRRFCRDRIPVHVRDRIRLDVDVSGRAITIVERRAPWAPEIGPEWTSMPIARLRLHATDGTWALFWSDSNNVWHRDSLEPTPQIHRLLARVADDPSNRYWG